MAWTREQILRRIANGENPAELGRRGGLNAHRIQDVLNNKGPGLYCRTAVHGWHMATPREVKVLTTKKCSGVKQHMPLFAKTMLSFS